MVIVPPLIQNGGLAKDVGARVGLGQLMVASLLTLPFVIPLVTALPIPVIVAIGASFIFALWFRRFLLVHLGGVTGDCLGFGVYAGQIAILLAATVSLP